jgi:hypothetical protein
MGNVKVINLTPYDKQPVPEVNKEYHTFDDGKISPSRHAITKVLEVIPFEIAEPWLIESWKKNVEECYWLYDKETDYFIKTEFEDEEDPSYFVRTTDGGWFSIGWWGARLDVTGKLYEGMLKWLEENK